MKMAIHSFPSEILILIVLCISGNGGSSGLGGNMINCWLCKKRIKKVVYVLNRYIKTKGGWLMDKRKNVCSDCFDSHCIFSLDKHPKEDKPEKIEYCECLKNGIAYEGIVHYLNEDKTRCPGCKKLYKHRKELEKLKYDGPFQFDWLVDKINDIIDYIKKED